MFTDNSMFTSIWLTQTLNSPTSAKCSRTFRVKPCCYSCYCWHSLWWTCHTDSINRRWGSSFRRWWPGHPNYRYTWFPSGCVDFIQTKLFVCSTAPHNQLEAHSPTQINAEVRNLQTRSHTRFVKPTRQSFEDANRTPNGKRQLPHSTKFRLKTAHQSK